jgi:[acyl-carrier-protein] S-malonyltransferase
LSQEYCVLFSGQSVQEEGMCALLWKLPVAREILSRLRPVLGEDLEDLTTRMSEEELTLTYNAQRAIHAHHLGHWFAFRAAHPEISLNGAIGHSVGIVAALVAAEAMSVEDSGRFVRERAEAFSEVCAGLSGWEGLAAISTDSVDDARDAIEGFPGVSLALHNTIGKGTIGGRIADLEAFAQAARREAWPLRVTPLKVEGPYHTRAFEACGERLRIALEKISVLPPRVPVFMGTSGKAETDPERIRQLLAAQPSSPELHLKAVRAAYEAGCRRFLEVASRPQPIHWLRDQLVDENGNPLSDVTARAVTTEEI